MGRPARRKNAAAFHGAVALSMAVILMLLLWGSLSGKIAWLPLLGCWLAAVNVTAFGYYGYDKSCARAQRGRVPETVLHGLTAAGGSLGACAAMTFFRHKTMKGKFRILFWCIVTLQVALTAWIVKAMWLA